MTNEPQLVENALASHTDDYDVERHLHTVPPHTTFEVWFRGRRSVCKVAIHPRGDPAMEAAVLTYLARETTISVPEPLAVGPDHVVTAWDDDVPQDAPDPVPATTARTMGAGLARLHEATGFDRPGFFVPAESSTDDLLVDGHDRWHATVQALLRESRDYLRRVAPADADVAERVLDLFRAHPHAFDGCGTPVLCHGDYLPAHVGVDDGAVRSVVDFEHALAGPAAYDYWRATMPLVVRDDTLEPAFRAGYESVRGLPAGVDRHRDLYWLVNSVSYLDALSLQDQADDVEGRAASIRDHVDDLLSTCRARLSDV